MFASIYQYKERESIRTTINGLKLHTPIFNASGCICTTHDDLKLLYDCNNCGAIVSKSSTLNSRVGNPHPRYFENELGSINSTGLANNGYHFYKEYWKKWDNKPFFLSIAVDENIMSILDNIEEEHNDIEQNERRKNDVIELNVSCPNLVGKPQLSYNFEELDETLRTIFEKNYSINCGLKLSPYFDPMHIDLASDIIKKYNINHITTINSIGNGLLIDLDEQKPCIKPKHGLGGIGGDYCKPTALANVFCFNKNIGNHTSIIGCGGIKTGKDVYEHILCGASAVQVGTHLIKTSVSCFDTLTSELRKEMKKHGYKNIEEFRGKLTAI
jgi:dihydroorotate dehydrogenase (fumarate)